MSRFKVSIDFSHFTAAKLGPAAQTIHDSMGGHPALFANPDPTLAELLGHITEYNARLAARASRSIADANAFDVARHDLEACLSELGNYVNGIAKGDESVCVASGFPFYDASGRRANDAPPPAPAEVVLRQGTLSGSFVARYRPGRTPSMNEVQICTGDPNVETAWKPAGMFAGGKATVSGIVPATTVWFRARTAGLKGVMGAWSDPARIIVV